MTTTNIDALAIKRQGAQIVATRLALMSLEQQQRFWEEQTHALRERQQAIRAEQGFEYVQNRGTAADVSLYSGELNY